MAYYPPQQAPAPYGSYPQAPGRWSTGLCECCDDVGNCCMTCWCPCVTFGRNAEILDRGTTSCGLSGAVYGLLCSLTGCQFIYSCMYRTKLRTQYNLPSDPCADCCVHLCCQPCALCQEFRELRNRGYDVKLGWHGNMERMAAMGTAVPPQVHGSMMR